MQSVVAALEGDLLAAIRETGRRIKRNGIRLIRVSVAYEHLRSHERQEGKNSGNLNDFC